MPELLSAENLIAFLTLAVLEIVLGIDNIVFIAILAGKLPEEKRHAAQRIGLAAAMITRILLLLGITWIMTLTATLFTVLGHEVSGKDVILMGGGLFLIAKATHEIHNKLEAPGGASDRSVASVSVSFAGVIAQIMVLDIVFSLDSVITAVGMAKSVAVMIAAIVVAVGVMMLFAKPVTDYIEKHPTLKMLALCFLLLIGMTLVIEGAGTHFNKGYIYFAMGFSLFVEVLNLRTRRKRPAAAV